MLIAAAVTENEGNALTLAVEQMRQLFARVSQREWKIECELRDDLRFDPERKPAVYIVSLLTQLDANEPVDRLRGRLHAELSNLVAQQPAVYLCTVFRGCEDDPPKLERIRRLNLLAVDLSHDLNVGVIDFDRQFADIGARPLQSNHRLEGRGACEIAAYVIVKALFATGAFDDHIDAETIEAARLIFDRSLQAYAIHA